MNESTQPVAEVSGVTDASPDRFERALAVMAGMAADMEATAKRCDAGGREGVAIERRTEADAVRMALIAAIVTGGSVDEAAAIVQAHKLIAEAVAIHG